MIIFGNSNGRRAAPSSVVYVLLLYRCPLKGPDPFELFLAAALLVRLRGPFGHVPLRVLRACGRAGRLGRVAVLGRLGLRLHLCRPAVNVTRPGRYPRRLDGRLAAADGSAAVIAVVLGRGRVTGRRRHYDGRGPAPCRHSGHAGWLRGQRWGPRNAVDDRWRQTLPNCLENTVGAHQCTQCANRGSYRAQLKDFIDYYCRKNKLNNCINLGKKFFSYESIFRIYLYKG